MNPKIFPIPSFIVALCLFFICAPLAGKGQEHRVLILGNIADISQESDFFSHLQSQVLAEAEVPLSLLVTGDLISHCEDGQPLGNNLEKLISLGKAFPTVQIVIVPGDRDWDHSGPEGWECVQALEEKVMAYGLGTPIHLVSVNLVFTHP